MIMQITLKFKNPRNLNSLKKIQEIKNIYKFKKYIFFFFTTKNDRK